MKKKRTQDFALSILMVIGSACGWTAPEDDGDVREFPSGQYCAMGSAPVVFAESLTTLSINGLDMEFEGAVTERSFTLNDTVSGLGEIEASFEFNEAVTEGTLILTVTLEGGGGEITLKQWLSEGACSSRDVDALGTEKILSHLFVDMDQIEDISLFRSSAGHDYSDDFESCRSMKHYFEPVSKQNSLNTVIAPVGARVVSLGTEEGGGFVDDGLTNQRVVLQPVDYPQYAITMFHVDLSAALALGDTVTAGQTLGHARLVRVNSGQSSSSTSNDFDIAVSVNTPQGLKLVSMVDVLSDLAFAEIQARATSAWGESSSPSRSDFIHSKDTRDATPLTCSGQTFTGGADSLPRWFR